MVELEGLPAAATTILISLPHWKLHDFPLPAGKPSPFQPQGSPAVPLLVAAALAVLAFVNLQLLAGGGGGASALLQAAPATLLQQVAAPLLLAGAMLFLMMKKGSQLVDKPQLTPELAVPWH